MPQKSDEVSNKVVLLLPSAIATSSSSSMPRVVAISFLFHKHPTYFKWCAFIIYLLIMFYDQAEKNHRSHQHHLICSFILTTLSMVIIRFLDRWIGWSFGQKRANRNFRPTANKRFSTPIPSSIDTMMQQ